MNSLELVSDLASMAAVDAVRRVNLGELTTMGDVTDYIGSAVTVFLNQYGPQVAQKLAEIAEPAARKAADIIGPVVEEKLRAAVPLFAGISGGLIGLSILAGIWISRTTFKATRRNPSRRRVT